MICALILAAGCSSRMGTQKLLLPFGDKTVISHIVAQVISSGIKEVCVVVGHRSQDLIKELSPKPIAIVYNPEYQSGMLSSVRAGLRNIPRGCRAVFVFLGDQPSITPGIIEYMIQAYASTEKKILVPVYNGKRGHPILLSTTYCEEILQGYDEVGLRGIMQAHAEDLLEIPFSEPDILSDMDYPEDYCREVEKYENRIKKV